MKTSIKLKLCLFLLLFGSAAAAETAQTKILQLSARLDNEEFLTIR